MAKPATRSGPAKDKAKESSEEHAAVDEAVDTGSCLASGVFWVLLVARTVSAMTSNISDCDETYNYWEPVSDATACVEWCLCLSN